MCQMPNANPNLSLIYAYRYDSCYSSFSSSLWKYWNIEIMVKYCNISSMSAPIYRHMFRTLPGLAQVGLLIGQFSINQCPSIFSQVTDILLWHGITFSTVFGLTLERFCRGYMASISSFPFAICILTFQQYFYYILNSGSSYCY